MSPRTTSRCRASHCRGSPRSHPLVRQRRLRTRRPRSPRRRPRKKTRRHAAHCCASGAAARSVPSMQMRTEMSARDPFPRRTATLRALVPWVGELGRTLPGLLRSYRGGVDPRTRERVILAVTEVNGCRYCAWIHGSWQDFLGENSLVDADEALLAYARACAEAGRPLDPAPLADVLPADAIASVRATVAQIEVSNLVGNTVDGLIARVTRKRPLDPVNAAGEV